MKNKKDVTLKMFVWAAKSFCPNVTGAKMSLDNITWAYENKDKLNLVGEIKKND